MPYNGAGVPSRLYNWVNDANAAINITASRMDGDSNDFINMFATAFCRDGQAVATGNWNLGTFGINNMANGSAAQSAATVGQIQGGSTLYGGTAGGTATAITFNLAPAISAYAAGQVYSFKASAASTGATTLNINAVGAVSLTRLDGSALQTGDIQNGQTVQVEYDGTKFQLLNRFVANQTVPPGTLLNIQVFTASGTYTPTSGTTLAVTHQVGGGGAGAGGATSSSNSSAGTGGGSGAYAIQKIASPGSLSVTIGAAGAGVSGGAGSSGGSTIFNGVTTSGGAAGATSAASTNNSVAQGGAGGTVSGGSPIVSIAGARGGGALCQTAFGISGSGGNSPLGSGGQGTIATSVSSGSQQNAGGYGAGGGGNATSNSAATTGGNGTAGILIVYEYS